MKFLIHSLVLIWLVVVSVTGARSDLDRIARIEDAVKRLRSQNNAERLDAKRQLLRPEMIPVLKNYSKQIVEILRTDLESEESLEILALVDLPKDLKASILSSPRTPDKVRARLGETEVERKLIALFRDEKSLYAVRKYALDLLYMDTPNTVKTFAAGLESKRVFTDVHGNQFSLVQILIQTYGQVHPDDALFSPSEYMKHNVGIEEFKGKEHQEYLRRIESFFRSEHGLSLHINPPLLLNDHFQEVFIVPTK